MHSSALSAAWLFEYIFTVFRASQHMLGRMRYDYLKCKICLEKDVQVEGLSFGGAVTPQNTVTVRKSLKEDRESLTWSLRQNFS